MESPEFEKLTDKEYELMEGLFPHYLFYNTLANGDRVFVCSRCRNEFIRQKIKRTITPDDRKIMCAAHGDLGRCPICGAVVTIKNTGKSRTCKNLQHSEKVVVLHAVNRDRVEARCYIVGKNYEQSYKPCLDIYEKSRYLLTPGKAIKFTRDYYSDNFFSVNTVGEPFPKAGMFYCVNEGYTVFGLDRLKGTFLEYNQLDSFISVDAQYYNGYIYTSPIMKYLSYFAMYPQLEMLQKLGHFDVVGKLVNENKKSFPYVNWKATSITGFFKMNKQEYRSFRKNGGTLGLLRMAYKIRPGKDRLDFEKAKIYLDCFGNEFNVERFISDVNEARIPLNEAFKYVLKKRISYIEYTDYLRIARVLGYDLRVHNVAFPKNLKEAHDNAASAEQAMLKEKRIAELKEQELKARKYLKKYEKQYSFTDGGYTIMIPNTVKEIVEEGKAMKHCVGGYAGRHMSGKLAILFLRLTAKPDESLYTIEMHNKCLTQVQGYNNRTPLTPEAKAFFDKWLSWVQNGSKRTKSGKPILKAIAKTA